MKKIDNKFVVYLLEGGKVDKSMIAYETNVPKEKINKWRLVWLILTDRYFLSLLSNTIKYAMMHFDCYRGSNASDVLEFKAFVQKTKLWDKGEEIE